MHIGELLPDGRPRFRTVLVLVARQNGKSLFCRLLTLFWMYVDRVPTVFGINSTRDTAKKSWKEVIKLAEQNPLLAEDLDVNHQVRQIGEEDFWNTFDSHYLFSAPNSRAGRSLTVNRAIIDELRQHKNRDAWDALIPTMNAIADAQAVIITNEGDESAIVLHELAESAMEYIDTGVGDPRLGMFSWSAPAGADPTDLEALAYANPDLGNRLLADSIIGQAITAKQAGGATLARFRVEIMCQRVTQLNPGVEPEAWKACGTDEPLDLATHRRSLALCFDVAIDGSHATLMGAATLDGITHVEVIKRWQGFGCTKSLRDELPGIVAAIRPRVIGWYPGGPSAAVASSLAAKRGVWPPRRVTVEELRAEVPAVCMGLDEAVSSGDVRHPKDAMLTTHVEQTQRLMQGDRWLFVRRGAKPIDGAYALAGAVHLARSLPPPPAPLSVA